MAKLMHKDENYTGGGVVATSNPNLLDNPWFTINQRGASSYSGSVYTVDRWKNGSVNSVLTVNSDKSVTLSKASNGSCLLVQYFESSLVENLVEKTVTISINVKSVVGNLIGFRLRYGDSSDAYINQLVSDYLSTGITSVTGVVPATAKKIRLEIYDATTTESSSSITVESVKLEIGSISTLAMDTAPNYQQELAKCQRYFQRHVQNSNISLIGYALPNSSGNLLTTSVRLFVPMRAIPTVSVSAVTDFYYGNHTSYTSMTEQPTSITRNGGTYQDISVAFGGMTGLTVGQLFALAGKGYIDFTADL